MVGYFLRFHPAVIYLKKYIQKNLSKLRMVNLEVGYDVRQWRPGRSIKNTVSKTRERYYKPMPGSIAPGWVWS